MACRVAGADSPTELWENLLLSKDVQRRITRFNIDGFYHPEGGLLKGLTNVDRAYMLDDEAVDKFDSAFFHVTPTEATAMDPQQRMLLEVFYEAIENTGLPLENFIGTDTAVFTGMLSVTLDASSIEGSDYHSVLARDPDVTPKYIVTGTANCMASNRLSYFYDLSGPSVSVDTACSSSMAALHQAVRTLQHGDSIMALVCGANLMFNPDSFVSMTELGFLSPSGRCRSFDAMAEGYGRGEGIAAVLLKPFRKAVEDQDPIRAVIKGTRLNQDGRTQGITMPSALAQQQNMDGLYKELKVDPSAIQYLEAHGTGTAAGDPLEMRAVNAVYVKNPLIVGSTKSNVGHCEAASALIGLIKTILCLENAQIPAQMHFETPNPAIDFTHRIVPMNTLNWPDTAGRPRRAAINTFGAGGTNGHAVLEAYDRPSLEGFVSRRPWLFKVSAADEISLQALSKALAIYTETRKPHLKDLAHTLLTRRSNLRHTRYVVASGHDELLTQLRSDDPSVVTAKNDDAAGNLLFVFTGQGAQWAQMGRTLVDRSPLARSVLQECDDVLRGLPDGPPWAIVDELSKAKAESNVDKAEYAQPLCTALQIGIISLLRSWGVRPDAVVGHSSGEIAAAYAAGMITLRTAVVTAYYRGLVLAGSATSPSIMESKGSMCAVGIVEDECISLIEHSKNRVQLAAVNSPRSCTLSGDRQAVQDIVKIMFSSVTGNDIRARDLTPSYWARNMTSTVRFASAIEETFRKQPDVNGIVEIGPHPALKGPIQEILGSNDRNHVSYFSTAMRDTDDFQSILENAGHMIAAGLPLDVRAVNATEVVCDGTWRHEHGNILTDLPTYKWNHSSSFWAESRLSQNTRFRAFPRHELLGSRCADDIPSRACWRNHLDLSEIDWLREILSEDVPGTSPAIYTLMGVEAAHQLWSSHTCDSSAVHMTDVKTLECLPFASGSQRSIAIETQFISRMDEGSSWMSFEIHYSSKNATHGWVLCCEGSLGLIQEELPMACGGPSAFEDDSILLQKAQACYPRLFAIPENVRTSCARLSKGMVQGTAVGTSNSWQEYPIQPQLLASVLSLGPVTELDQNLPVNYRVISMDKLHICIKAPPSSPIKFSIGTKRTLAGGAKSEVAIYCGHDNILAGTVRYGAIRLIFPRPTTSSLFFRPVCLPDITKHLDARVISIERCLQLLTHKWPMCDVKIGDIPGKVQTPVLELLSSREAGPNSRFRSITLCKGVKGGVDDDRIRVAKENDGHLPMHVTFADQVGFEHPTHRFLQPSGLACIRGSGKQQEQHVSESFQYICEVAGLDDNPWTLWRVKNKGSAFQQHRKTVIFSPCNFPLMKGPNFVLDPQQTREFAARPGLGRFAAVVVDDPAKSVITGWPGKDLIPWLQHLMKHAESLLWVSMNASSSPFVNVAGTLLRTLQAEQPSLKVCWLVVDDADTEEASLSGKIEDAYTAMLQGDNELRLELDSKETRITRYLPDEDLSLATGMSLSHQVQDPLGDKDYALALAAPEEAVVLSYDSDDPATFKYTPSNGSTDAPAPYGEKEIQAKGHRVKGRRVKVAVVASLLSGDDLAAYRGVLQEPEESEGCQCRNTSEVLGNFFAGKVLGSGNPSFKPESIVVGWTNGAHVKIVDVPEGNIYPATSDEHSRTVAEFASLATAMAVFDGHIRARKGDHFQYVNVDNMLREAFVQACQYLHVAQSEQRTPYSPTFVIEVSDKGNVLLVNNMPVNNVTSYLETRPTAFSDLWNSHKELTACSWQTYPFTEYRKAFEDSTSAYNSPTVLIHGQDTRKLSSHVPIRQPPRDLAKDTKGAYIIIGGLGGLGRYVCEWLVEQGAEDIYVISRSGTASPEAQSCYDKLQRSKGVQLRVVQADACDRDAMSSILSSIRSKQPIKGVINMAMVLGDAPLASMTGEEWDRALRVKIDSSWILHELTQEDDLAVFILFSSIASVLGNRGQGGYNVGNAFLNALAVWRRKQGKVGVSIALGAMTDVGVLTTLPSSSPSVTAAKLTRSGLSRLTTPHFAKILEAAFLKSRRQRVGKETEPEEALIVTGLEMFEKEMDGSLIGKGRRQGERLFWTELPEFSHLSTYRPPNRGNGADKEPSLKERVKRVATRDAGKELRTIVREAVLGFLSTSLGFKYEAIDPGKSLGMYGMDSLNAVGCQFWCFRELGAEVSVKEIFEAKSIEVFVKCLCKRIVTKMGKEGRD
ncbi:MAG: hypothetical protein LQ338_005156 [Usnochroma carphineum]|nr:MAG: hypothetical protein LQ338_005156 [Usnochroma carphineum]